MKVIQRHLIVIGVISCFIFTSLIFSQGAYGQSDETPVVFNYQQKMIGNITEKNTKIRVAISRFEEKVQIDGSPYNIEEETEEEDVKDIKIEIEGLVRETRDDLDDEEVSKAELLTGLLTDKLRKTGIFDVVERQEINELIREIKFEKSNWVKQDSVNKLGNIYSVQYIVTGDILQNKDGHRVGQSQYTLALRVYSVNTGEIIASSTSQQNNLEAAVDEGVKIMADEIAAKPWTCRVVRIKDDDIYINAGEVDSIEKDDVFAVFRVTGEIKDPITNKILGSEKTKLGKIKVQEVLDRNLSRATVIEGSQEIQIGDTVEAKKIDIMDEDDEISKWNEIFGEEGETKSKSSVQYNAKSFKRSSSGVSSVEDIVRDFGESIVLIQTDRAMGSGFIVSSNGYILTNSHVISGTKNVTVKIIEDNRVYSNVEVIKDNPIRDMALLKITDTGSFNPVILGNSDDVQTGERVVALGNPKGLENTVADGLISAIRDNNGTTMLQISVPISPGSSGGALFNMRGEVIGITTAGYEEGQNLNFAVAINYAKDELLDQLY